MRQEEAKQQIVRLWMEWLASRERKTLSQDMQVFYAYLQREHSQVLAFRAAGDKWQTVKAWIQDVY